MKAFTPNFSSPLKSIKPSGPTNHFERLKQIIKFEFIDEDKQTGSFDLPAVSQKIFNNNFDIPQDFQLIGFAVLPNDDESVKWLEFLYWKSPKEVLREAIQGPELVSHADSTSPQKMKEYCATMQEEENFYFKVDTSNDQTFSSKQIEETPSKYSTRPGIMNLQKTSC